MTHKFTASSLDDIAKQFDKFAEGSDARAAFAMGLHDRLEYINEARVWREAADVLRHTTLKTPK